MKQQYSISFFTPYLIIISFLFFYSTAFAATGLTVENNTVIHPDTGKEYRAMGVNFYDGLLRRIRDSSDTSYRDSLKVLGDNNIPFARVAMLGFNKADFTFYKKNKANYFKYVDDFLTHAERNNVGIITSFFWNKDQIPNYLGKNVKSEWENLQSDTWRLANAFINDFVGRYKNHKMIWAWEMSNEWNLFFDIPNNKQSFSRERMRDIQKHFRNTITAKDKSSRMIISGYSSPRPASWHNTFADSWERDSMDEFSQAFMDYDSAYFDAAVIHAYPDNVDGNYFSQVSLQEYLKQLKIMADKYQKPLFVEEFGSELGKYTAKQQKDHLNRFFKAIVDLQIPLSAIWVFDRVLVEQPGFEVHPEYGQKWIFDKIKTANNDFSKQLQSIKLQGEFRIENIATKSWIRPLKDENYSELGLVSSDYTGDWTKWKIENAGNGYYRLRHKVTGRRLRPIDEKEFSHIYMAPANLTGHYTHWRFEELSPGIYRLINRATGKFFRPVNNKLWSPLYQVDNSFTGDYTKWRLVFIE